MVDEGDSSSQDLNGNREAMEEMQEVVVNVPSYGAQDITLQIRLNFPEGVALNDKAPNKWKVESHGQFITRTFRSVTVYIIVISTFLKVSFKQSYHFTFQIQALC